MITKEQRKEIETACKSLYVGNDYKSMYIHLNNVLRNYSTLLAEHNPEFGDISDKEASLDIFTLRTIIDAIEPLIIEDLDKA